MEKFLFRYAVKRNTQKAAANEASIVQIVANSLSRGYDSHTTGNGVFPGKNAFIERT